MAHEFLPDLPGMRWARFVSVVLEVGIAACSIYRQCIEKILATFVRQCTNKIRRVSIFSHPYCKSQKPFTSLTSKNSNSTKNNRCADHNAGSLDPNQSPKPPENTGLVGC